MERLGSPECDIPRIPPLPRRTPPAGTPRERHLGRRAGAGLALVAALCCAVAVAHTAGLARPMARSQSHPTAATRPSPTSTPVAPTPTATPGIQVDGDPAVNGSVAWYLSRLSLDEKLGQMLLIETYYKDYAPDVDVMVRQLHAGAVIVYGKNIQSWSQVHAYLAAIQAHAGIPLLTTIDEEGGNVDRLGYLHLAQPLPSAQWLGSTGNPALALDAGARAAQELKALGFNTDLAPVVDLRLTSRPIEGPRLYGTDPATVDRFAGAYLQGLQQNGIIGSLKHWPGIGSITSDPHQTLPVIGRSRADFEAADFAAFRGLLAQRPGMIMVTHVLVPAIDPRLPATLSPTFVDGILRGELGYNGVVMTDSLYMKGISLRYSLPQAAVMAVQAGDDLLEGAWDGPSMRSMLGALKDAIHDGRISRARIDQSVARILALKVRFGLLPLHAPPSAAPSPSPLPTFAPRLDAAGPVDLAPFADRARPVLARVG